MIDADNWGRAFPYYRRVSHPVNRNELDPHLERAVRNLYPRGFTDTYDSFITLCTLGSIQNAFRRTSRTQPAPGQQLPQPRPLRYDWVFIDEASQVSEVDILSLFSLLSTTLNEVQGFPRISFLGDPIQIGPYASGPPSIFKLVQQCSFFDRLIARNVPSCPGPNTVQCIVLDRQFRMHPHISALVNRISGRTTETMICGATPWMLEHPQYYNRTYDGLLPNLCNNVDFANPVIWFDPYARFAENSNFAPYVELAQQHASGREYSVMELVCTLLICRHLLHHGIIQHPRDILILTCYSRQKSLLRRVLDHGLQDILPFREEFRQACIRTIDTAEGAEARTVIFCPGRDPTLNSAVGETSHLNSLRKLHVLASRAQRRLFFIGSRQFFRDNCPTWAAALDFFDMDPANI